MKVVQFPVPVIDRPKGPEENAPQSVDPVLELRAQLIQIYAQRQKRKKPSRKTPVSILADCVQPADNMLRLGKTQINPLAIFTQWLGHIQNNAHLSGIPEHRTQAPGGSPQNRPPQASATKPERSLDAFWSAWMDQSQKLHKFALRMLNGNLADAEDALSAAMIQAQRAFDPDKIHNPAAWFNRLVRNSCIDLHRHRARTSTMGDRVESVVTEAALPSPAGTAICKSGEEELMANESFADVLLAILELPADLMEPLLLRCLSELPYDNIASDMELSNVAVRKRVQLARKKLQRIML